MKQSRTCFDLATKSRHVCQQLRSRCWSFQAIRIKDSFVLKWCCLEHHMIPLLPTSSVLYPSYIPYSTASIYLYFTHISSNTSYIPYSSYIHTRNHHAHLTSLHHTYLTHQIFLTILHAHIPYHCHIHHSTMQTRQDLLPSHPQVVRHAHAPYLHQSMMHVHLTIAIPIKTTGMYRSALQCRPPLTSASPQPQG